MSTLRERQRQLRVDAILETAYRLLLDRGYDKMTMDEIAAQVGIAKMTLYSHFASKEALVVALVVRRMHVLLDELRRIAQSERPAGERLAAMMQHTLADYIAKWEANIGLERRAVFMAPEFQAIDTALAETWREVVAAAQQEGSVRPDLTTAVIVQMLRRLYLLGFEELLTVGSATAGEIVQTMLAIIFDGLSARLDAKARVGGLLPSS